jgi:hypothetical protein
MGKITPLKPVKLFIGMLAQDVSLFTQVKESLESEYGPVDLDSPVWPWDHTQYYEKEMGTGLKRNFIFFKETVGPDDIAEIKLRSNELEEQYLNNSGGRKINLDPGYLDSAKVVLVSTKDFSHRIYLGEGIYGEVTLYYSGNNYQTLPYTFPDYRTQEYRDVFKKARKIYKIQMKT